MRERERERERGGGGWGERERRGGGHTVSLLTVVTWLIIYWCCRH